MPLLPLLAALWLGPAMPMPVRYEDSAAYRWKNKPVLESRVLDEMESLDHWSPNGKCDMALTEDRAISGTHSLRMRLKTRTPDDVFRSSSRNFGYAGVFRQFAGEDWSGYNRISFWLYPDLPGWRVVTLRMVLKNEGRERLPDVYDNDGNTAHVGLNNHQWNRVVWEIPYLPRDKVTSLGFVFRRQGNEPEASDTIAFDIDHLTLDRVEADQFEGWNVAPGRISFSHTGYQTASRKTALASDLPATRFDLIDQATGETVLSKPVETVTSPLGRFEVMDFTEFTKPGRYTVRAGNLQTRPFAIADEVWRDTVWKIINFFYTERCGWDVPGSHRICHRDWLGVHGDKKMVINGGWHDAGDLSQGLVNTSEGVYAMLNLAEQLRAKGDSDLASALTAEAKWGLDWVEKTSFGDGYRITWATMGPWTDGIIGNNDDVTSEATNEPYDNFLAAATEALAARLLKTTDPELAAYSLRLARRDWQFAIDKFAAPVPSAGMSPLTAAATGIIASLDLWRATGEAAYAAKAIELAPFVVKSQERGFQGRTEPITGFFYRSPDKRELLHFFHDSHEEAPIVALTRLCEAFPDNQEWMEWYTTVALHSEYFLKAMARFTEPYGVLPNSLYRDDEYLQAPEKRREAFRRQVLNGLPVGNRYYLRRFPVWFDFRGHFGTVLTATKALSTAARLRGLPQLDHLAETQLQWVVGRNPFSMSTMYGEGYDYAPLYSAMSGHLVGALPVGIESHGNADAPYWPASNFPNWKEVWVHPAARWLAILTDLLPPKPTRPLFTLSREKAPGGQIRITLTARGSGRHRFALRAWNLEVTPMEQELALSAGQPGTIVWQGKPVKSDSPWVVVVIPDRDQSQFQEILP